MEVKKNILVAPLNWGLGHATRCIPIIRALEENGFNPIIASDGQALALLKKEFPHLLHLELPAYDIQYAEKGKNFKWKLLAQLPKMIKAIKTEKKKVEKWISEHQLSGIISDNRLGVHSKAIPSVFITHQLKVLTGSTSWLTTKIHEFYIQKFNECWIPDNDVSPNLSGDLGHSHNGFKHLRYIGPLSRLYKRNLPLKYNLMVILSGPEPQRTLLEEKLLLELQTYTKPVLFIKGVVSNEQKIWQENQITFYNFMNSEQLETAFNESDKIVCRSGYTTIMDLTCLSKKAFFIPTPGQYEQEYLARKYQKENLAPYCKQEKFIIEKLDEIEMYRGFQNFSKPVVWKDLFYLF